MKRLALAVTALLFCACVAHEKAGDSAAAVGDWKTAYNEYREAVEKEPERGDLREKFERAKREAVSDAQRRSQGCAQQQDWQCAVSEADFALAIEPGDAALQAFRTDAGKQLARARLSQAHQRAVARDYKGAAELLEQAERASNAPESRDEAVRARAELGGMIDAEAEGLRRQRAYPEAMELFALAAKMDGARAGKLAAVQAEYDQFLNAEHDRLAAEGDAALNAKDWDRANERYTAAAQRRPNGRAAPLAAYALSLSQGDNAARMKNYAQAEECYRRAAQTGMDKSGYAQDRLTAVQLRPWSIRIRSVLVAPSRPDGFTPWAGSPDGVFNYIMRGFVGRMGNLQSPSTKAALVTLAPQIPAANQPNLVILATLPDGSQLETPVKKALAAPFTSRFAVVTNVFDDRSLTLRVVHRDPGGDVEMGLVDVPLGRLVDSRQGSFWGGSVADLQLTAEPYDGRPEMATVDMQVVRGAGTAAASPPPPSGATAAPPPPGGQAQPQAVPLGTGVGRRRSTVPTPAPPPGSR